MSLWNNAETLNRIAFCLVLGGSIAVIVGLVAQRRAKSLEDQRTAASTTKIEQLGSANTQLSSALDASKAQVAALETQTAELKRKALPRALTSDQRAKMLAELRKAGRYGVAVACHMFDLESCTYATQIYEVFVEAGWEVAPLIKNSTTSFEHVLLGSNLDPSSLPAFGHIRRALSVAGIKSEPHRIEETKLTISPLYPGLVHVIVGPKPLS